MPTIEEMLVEETYKGVHPDMSERIFRTLNHIERLEPKRTSKLLSELIEKLHQKGLLSEDEIDSLLLDAIT